jgi:hypothetical protein
MATTMDVAVSVLLLWLLIAFAFSSSLQIIYNTMLEKGTLLSCSCSCIIIDSKHLIAVFMGMKAH